MIFFMKKVGIFLQPALASADCFINGKKVPLRNFFYYLNIFQKDSEKALSKERLEVKMNPAENCTVL